jgi:hypothetical protein
VAIAVDKASIGGIVQEPVNSTVAFTTNQTVASNGFIVLICTYWHNGTSATLSSVSGGGLSWTIDVDVVSANGGGNPRVAIISAQAPSGLASGTTITGTFSASLNGSMAGLAGSSFTGVKTSSPVDVTTARNDTTDQTWATASASIQAGSLLYGGAFNFSAQATSTPTQGTEATDFNNAVGGSAASNYRIESSAGSYTLGGSWTAGANSVSVSVAYLAAAGGASSVKAGAGIVGP